MSKGRRCPSGRKCDYCGPGATVSRKEKQAAASMQESFEEWERMLRCPHCDEFDDYTKFVETPDGSFLCKNCSDHG